VNARGAISLPPGDHSALIQRARLEAEGVAFDGDRIALERWGWQPHTAAGRPTPRSTP
jgi:alkylated DNA nucleotide flippase Atl1